MYSSVLMNAAHIQAEPLNGYATCIQYYITEYSPQVLRKRDESVTKTMHGPRGSFHGLTNTRAKTLPVWILQIRRIPFWRAWVLKIYGTDPALNCFKPIATLVNRFGFEGAQQLRARANDGVA